jgi:hypothetical protein
MFSLFSRMGARPDAPEVTLMLCLSNVSLRALAAAPLLPQGFSDPSRTTNSVKG